MKMIRFFYLFAALTIFLAAVAAQAQTTVFTYQGKLNDASLAQPTNGNYDFLFRLFDADGVQLPNAQRSVTNVGVVNGIFTVQLDFGNLLIAPATDLFLDISVRRTPPANTPPPLYQPLAPRQQLTSAPFAVQALNSTLFGNFPVSQFIQTGDARLSDERNPLPGSDNYIQNTPNQQSSAYFNIGGTGAASVFNAATEYQLGGVRILAGSLAQGNFFAGSLAGANNLGFSNTFVGAVAGQHNTSGNGNTFVGTNAGNNNTTGSSNVFIGALTGVNNSTGDNNVFIGRSTGNSNTVGSSNTIIGFGANVGGQNVQHSTAIGADAEVVSNNTIVLGTSNDTVVVPKLSFTGNTQVCRNQFDELSFCSSSLRYKTNIAPFAWGLELIRQLRPISFDWKNGGMKDVGFGAEDVAKVNPLFVTFNAKGEVEGVKYDRLSVVFVNAFNEQQEQIAAQQKQIEAQQKQIEELRAVVCSLKPAATVCVK